MKTDQNSIKLNSILNVIQKTCNILIPLIIFPYLSRVLGPDNYGKYSFANSINCYFLLAAMLGINTYAVREGARIRDDREKIDTFVSEIFSINLLSLLITYAVLILFLIGNSKAADYRSLILILSIILPCTVLGRDYINTIYEDYIYMTIRYIVVQVLGLAAVFLFVRESDDYWIYTIIYMATVSLGYIINFFYVNKYVPFKITLHLNLKKHLAPIIILFCGQIATTIYLQSDITMIGIYKNDAMVGIYTIASRIYGLSKSVINAITTAIIPRMVFYLGKNEKEKYNSLASRLVNYLLLFTLPSAVGLGFMNEDVLLIVGGDKYLSGGTSLAILSIALLFAVFSGFYCNGIMIPHRKEKEFLIITVISACINIGLNFFLIPLWGMTGAAITTLLSEIVVMVLAMWQTRKLVSIQVPVLDIISIIAGSTVIAGICIAIKAVIQNPYAEFIAAVVASGLCYVLVLYGMGNSICREMIQGIWKRIFPTKK